MLMLGVVQNRCRDAATLSRVDSSKSRRHRALWLRQLFCSLQSNFLADGGYGISDLADNLGELGFRESKSLLYQANLHRIREIDCIAERSGSSLTHVAPLSANNRRSTSFVPRS
jgi:hypothetical protein